MEEEEKGLLYTRFGASFIYFITSRGIQDINFTLGYINFKVFVKSCPNKISKALWLKMFNLKTNRKLLKKVSNRDIYNHTFYLVIKLCFRI